MGLDSACNNSPAVPTTRPLVSRQAQCSPNYTKPTNVCSDLSFSSFPFVFFPGSHPNAAKLSSSTPEACTSASNASCLLAGQSHQLAALQCHAAMGRAATSTLCVACNWTRAMGQRWLMLLHWESQNQAGATEKKESFEVQRKQTGSLVLRALQTLERLGGLCPKQKAHLARAASAVQETCPRALCVTCNCLGG